MVRGRKQGSLAGLVAGVALLLAACRGAGATDRPAAQIDPGPQPDHQQPVAALAPGDFAAPDAIGGFVRESLRGSPLATGDGGSAAVYRGEGGSVLVSTFLFDSAEDAAATVRYTLSAPVIAARLDDSAGPARHGYGVARDRHGGYLAAWSDDGWVYVVRTTAGLDTLRRFLDAFPF